MTISRFVQQSHATAPVIPDDYAPDGIPHIAAKDDDSLFLADVTGLSDRDGLGPLAYQWLRDGAPIAEAVTESYRFQGVDVGRQISVDVSYTDGRGSQNAVQSLPVGSLAGGLNADNVSGTSGRDAIFGLRGDDSLKGSSGADFLIGGLGDDFLYGEDLDVALAPDVAAQVFRLYRASLDRVPDAGGHLGWTGLLFEGAASLADPAAGFVGSPEFQNVYGTLDDAAFVELLYQNVLGRAPDADGLAGWTGLLAGGTGRADVVLGFSEGREFVNATRADSASYNLAHTDSIWVDDVYRIYQATLNRAPDLPGLLGWTEHLGSGTDFLTVVAGFVRSPEFQNTYGALDDTAFVNLLLWMPLGLQGISDRPDM